jgi:hypothetical protein
VGNFWMVEEEGLGERLECAIRGDFHIILSST